MIWKTTLTKIFLPAENVKKEFHALPLLENSGNALTRLTLVMAFLFFAPLVAQAQNSGSNGNNVNTIITGDDCIDFGEKIPQDQVVCATDVVNGVAGAYIDWITPNISQSCTGSDNAGSFQMQFELNESLLAKDCWNFTFVQRVGINGGYVKLFSSNNNNADNGNKSVITTPYLVVEAGSKTTIQLEYGDGDYNLQLFLVPENGTPIPSGDPQQVDHSGVYEFTIGQTGVYRLQYVFTYTGTRPPKANTGDTIIAIQGILYDTGCSGGVDFVVTGPEKGFYPVGSHDLEYVATYTAPDGVTQQTKTLSFNVTVVGVDAPVSSGNITECEASPLQTLDANNALGSTTGITWYTAATEGTVVEDPILNAIGEVTYYAEYNDGTCASLERTPVKLTILENPVAAIENNNGLALSCNVPSTTLTATGGTSYLWSTGETTPSITVSTAGTFTVTVTGANGCTSTASVTTTLDNTQPAAAISNNNGLALSCNVPSTTLTATGGTSYSWSTGETTPSITVSAAGTFTVTVTGANGCTSTASVTTTLDNTLPDAEISSDNGTLLTCANPSTTFTATGGTSYSWSNGSEEVSTSATLEVNTAGTFTVTVTGANGCTSTASVTTTLDNTQPTAAISSNNGTELTCANPSTTFTATGGTSYTWSTGESTPSITVNVAGTFTVTVTGANGCTSTASVTTTLDNTQPTAAISNSNGLALNCNVPSTTLTATGGTSYSWSNGSEEVSTSATLEVSTAGTFTVTVTGANGCTSTASVTTTLDNTQPTAAISSDNGIALTCANPSTTLTATGGTSYSWSTGETTPSITVSTAGTFTVTVTGANGCTSTASVTTTLDSTLPTAAISNNNGTALTCTTPSTTFTATGGTSYLWSTGETTPSITVSTAGTFTVTVTGANGCTSTASVTTTLDNTQPTAEISNNNGLALSCNNPSTTLNATGGTSYLWSTGETTPSIIVSTAGTFTVTVTGANGCTSTSSVTTTLDNTQPVAAISNNNGLSLSCNVPSTTLTATGGTSYSWSTGATTPSIAVSTAGIFTVTVTGTNGCIDTETVEVLFIEDTTAPESITLADVTGECSATVIAPTTTDNCAGTITATTDAPLTYNEQGEYTVTWTFNDGNGNITSVDQKVIVKDTNAPEAITLADVTGECEASVVAPTTTDNCAGTITATTEDALTYNGQGEYMVTWIFNDGNGNTTSVDQKVIVKDTTAPEAITLQTVTGNCEVTVTAPSTNDNCSGTITGTTSDPLTYTELGNYEITWTFDDGNGNTTTATQQVVVENNTAPVAPVLEDAVAECEITVPVPSTTNACTGETIQATTNAPLTYSEQGEYFITWTFDDEDGNVVSSVQKVIVKDNTAPESITLADVTGECSATVTAPTTTDNCAGTITATTEDALTYTEQGEYVVTWTFNDGNGNITTVDQNVIVKDTTAPQAITLADVTGECSATVIAPTTTDNCAGTITATTEDALTYTEQGEYVITWTFNDGNGNITTVDQNVIVKDSTAPEAITLADVTGECSATVVAPTTTDNCAETITATTDDALTYTEQGEYVVTWTFNDGNGNITTVDQNVIVKDTTAPEAITLADVTGECEATVTAPTTTDSCAGTITATTNDALTYTEQGEYVVTWTFNDGNGNITTVDQNVIVKDTTAPEAITLADVTGNCEVTVTAPTTTDNCAGTITGTTNDPLTYSELGTYQITWTFNDGNGNTTTARQQVIVSNNTAPVAPILADAVSQCEITIPAPTTTNACTGETITGTTNDAVSYSEQGNYTISWTFDDGDGNVVSSTQNVIINDTTAPEAITLADVTLECSATVTAPTTTDNCAGTITATTDAPLTYTEQGEYVVTWTFNDGNGNITTVDQKVIVNDTTAPEIITLADVTGECSATVTAPTTTDNCAGTITATTDAPLTYTEQGEYVVTWTFNDGNGNITTVEQNVIVKDTTAPEAITLADVTGECEATVVAPTTTDNCAGTITATTEDALTYNEQGEYVVTWTFNDGNGNVTTVEQNVIVKDTTAPDAITLADVTGECEATVTAPTTTDNCAGTITATTEDALTYTEQGKYVVTWTFNDGNGNMTSVDQNVIVKDTTAPDAITLADVTGECSATVTAPTTIDNCAGTITATTDDALTYTEQGEYVVTWTFNDGNGNITTVEQNVIVKDTTAPDAITLADVTGECEATVVAPTTTDNCAGTITATTDVPLTYTEQGEYVVIWTFNDGNGNITTVNQKVIVKDTTAPDAITLAEVTGECEATVVAPTTTDNCAGTITATTDAPLTYTEQGEYVVTWTFNDGNGNITTVEQNVIVKDTTAPDAISLADVTGECEATVVAPTTTDNCAGTITATTNDALTYTEKGEYMVTWTFNDGNGNITTADQKVTITGIEKPALGQIIQPSCANPSGSFSITAVAGMTYSLNGGEFGPATTFEGLSSGTYTVTAKSAQGCISEAVSVTINETPDAPAAPVVEELMQATCEDPSGFLVLTIVEGVSFTLTDANGNTFTDEDADGIFEDLTPGSYSVTAQNADGCVSNAITVTIEEPQGNVSITNPTSPICDDAEEMFDLNSLLSADTSAGTWVDTDQTGALSGSMLNPDMAAGFYTFTYVVEGACPSSTEVTIEIEDCGEELPCQISDIRNSISKVVTPNNDQINDKFEVGIGIDCGFTYTLKVFNRWGNEVFSSNNYSDEWDGNSSNSVTGDQLPSGTYFYIVEIKQSGFEPIQGYIYLGTK